MVNTSIHTSVQHEPASIAIVQHSTVHAVTSRYTDMKLITKILLTGDYGVSNNFSLRRDGWLSQRDGWLSLRGMGG